MASTFHQVQQQKSKKKKIHHQGKKKDRPYKEDADLCRDVVYFASDVSIGPVAGSHSKGSNIPQEAVETMTSQIKKGPVEQQHEHCARGIDVVEAGQGVSDTKWASGAAHVLAGQIQVRQSSEKMVTLCGQKLLSHTEVETYKW